MTASKPRRHLTAMPPGPCDVCHGNGLRRVAYGPDGELRLCVACLAAGMLCMARSYDGEEEERTTGLEPATSGLGSRRSTSRAASAKEVERCSGHVDGGRCAGLAGHGGEHYANARARVAPGPRDQWIGTHPAPGTDVCPTCEAAGAIRPDCWHCGGTGRVPGSWHK